MIATVVIPITTAAPRGVVARATAFSSRLSSLVSCGIREGRYGSARLSLPNGGDTTKGRLSDDSRILL